MIAQLTGTLLHVSPTEVVVGAGGVGYAVHIPLSTFDTLKGAGSEVTLFTHLHVREDALQLYGFATADEREIFKLLLSVSGIGPKTALAVLSGVRPADLRSLIQQGDASALTSLPGIGRKTAERLLVDLRDRIGKTPAGIAATAGATDRSAMRNEALGALLSLGYAKPAAETAIRTALVGLEGKEYTLQTLLKTALQTLNR